MHNNKEVVIVVKRHFTIITVVIKRHFTIITIGAIGAVHV